MEYLNLLNSIILSLCISIAVLGISYAAIRKLTDKEKSSTYECGFHPFQSSRGKFHVHFYLIAILFLIFDLEIILLLPWSSGQLKHSFLCTSTAYTFLILLILIYAYEWKKGGMDWSMGNPYSNPYPLLSGLLHFLFWYGITDEILSDSEELSEFIFKRFFYLEMGFFGIVGTIIWTFSHWEDLKHDIKFIYQTILDKFKGSSSSDD